MERNNLYSVGEAAVLSRVPLDKVRREIEHGVLSVEHSDTRVQLSLSDVIYLGLLRRLEADEVSVARERRSRLARALKRHPPAVAWREEISTTLQIDWHALELDLEPRVSLYERGRDRIVEDPDILGGEPVFKGTRLAVRHIGGMRLKGESIGAILGDYPYLNADDVAFAAMYAESHPRLGRPRRESA